MGARIRKFRNECGLTQRDLADAVGITESAIRNYERDIRTPSDSQIEKIADALGVSPDSIRDMGVSGARGALEVLFRFERELGLKPVITYEGIAVVPDSRKRDARRTAQALELWKCMRDQLEAGEMSEEEYENWKARFQG